MTNFKVIQKTIKMQQRDLNFIYKFYENAINFNIFNIFQTSYFSVCFTPLPFVVEGSKFMTIFLHFETKSITRCYYQKFTKYQ